MRPEFQKIAGYAALAVFVSMIFATADYTVRIMTRHLAIPGNGPNSTNADLILADGLKDTGSGPGSKVAIIGDDTGAYWARLGRPRIVSEIMGMNHGSTEFWTSSEEVRQQVYNGFRQAHTQLVASTCPMYPGVCRRVGGHCRHTRLGSPPGLNSGCAGAAFSCPDSNRD